jgi:hypothetical protein
MPFIVIHIVDRAKVLKPWYGVSVPSAIATSGVYSEFSGGIIGHVSNHQILFKYPYCTAKPCVKKIKKIKIKTTHLTFLG